MKAEDEVTESDKAAPGAETTKGNVGVSVRVDRTFDLNTVEQTFGAKLHVRRDSHHGACRTAICSRRF